MVNLLKPILVNLLTSRGARQLLIEVLEKLVKQPDKELDDTLVAAFRRALLPTN